MSETEERVVVKERLTARGIAWRAGCIVVWLPLMLLPLALMVLALNGEIVFWHGAQMPENAAHPWFRATLLMDADTRGVNITRSSVVSGGEDGLTCVQTDVSFLLWQGRGEPAQYCDCYQRLAEGEDWMFISTERGACGG
jgi:hypothetical protein